MSDSLTPEEREQLVELFGRATGLKLKPPSDATPPANLPGAWAAEFLAATAPMIRALESTASQRRYYQR